MNVAIQGSIKGILLPFQNQKIIRSEKVHDPGD